MGRKNISLQTFRGQLNAIIDVLEKRTVDLSVKHIIIVPDRVTLTAEVLLCSRLGGAFDVSVMTFNRLFTRYASKKEKYLSAQGSIMIIKKLLVRYADKLTCFTRSVRKKGFSQKLYETISMLIGCGVSPDGVASLKGKGGDLSFIYRKYLEETGGKLIDAGGRLTLLRDFLQTDPFITNAHIHICCFDNITYQMNGIIDIMEARALSLSVYSLSEDKYSLEKVTLYSSPNRVATAKAVVSRIVGHIKKRCDCDDFCIVTADGKAEEVQRILDENKLPYSSVTPCSLASHPLGRLLSAVINAALKGLRPQDIIKLSKNILSGVPKADSDCFERYVTKYNVSYEFFNKPFTLCDEKNETIEIMRSAERARKKLSTFYSYDNNKSVKDIIQAVLDSTKQTYEKKLKAVDVMRADPYKKAEELLELISSLLADVDKATQGEAFIAAMESVELGSAPKLKNCIEIGDEGAFRGQKFKYVYILDFDRDNHPRAINDTSLISDDDITSLRANDIIITPKVSEVNKRQEHEFMQLLSGADEVFLGYCGSPCAYWASIESECDIRETEHISYEDEYAELITAKSGEIIKKHCCTKSYLTELYRTVVSLEKDGFDTPVFLPYLKAACGKDAEKFDMPLQPTELPRLKEVCFESTSVSQLETYFDCPQKHFFRYGLKVKPLEKGEVIPVDIGNILHRTAEKYVKEGVSDPEQAAIRLIDECIAEYENETRRECNSGFKKMMRKEAKLLLCEIHRHFAAGSYTSLDAEKSFGDNDDGILLKLSGGETIRLKGKIDRVDVCGKLCRVVDYKTGKKDFDLADIYSGKSLQLMIYLGVLTTDGKEPGGAYCFEIKANFDDEELTMKGITNDSSESLASADREIALSGKSSVVNVKTSQGK